MIVTTSESPQLTAFAPLGVAEPFAPAETVIVLGAFAANDAAIVWPAVTLVNV